jgi:hypothetical protein
MVTTRARTSMQGPRLSATVAVLWRSFCRDAFDPYRPELHYMRGPGPKWRAKHGISGASPAVPPGTTVAAAL